MKSLEKNKCSDTPRNTTVSSNIALKFKTLNWGPQW